MLELRTVGAATATPELAAMTARLGTLEDVVRRPELMILAVIVQDEYTHDVVIAAGAQFLVYDST